MAEAFLMLDDTDGAIALHVEYTGGFDKSSPAHQHMALLVKAMDTLAQKIPDAEPALNPIAQVRYDEALALAEGRAQEIPG